VWRCRPQSCKAFPKQKGLQLKRHGIIYSSWYYMIIWVYKQISWDLNMGQNLKNLQIRRFWWFCVIFKYILTKKTYHDWMVSPHWVPRQLRAALVVVTRFKRVFWMMDRRSAGSGRMGFTTEMVVKKKKWTKHEKMVSIHGIVELFVHIWNNLDESHGCRNEIAWDHH